VNLDPRTLLFSLILTNSLVVLSLFVAISGGNGERQRDGLGKWAAAMLLETLTWTLVAARGHIPDAFSIIVANGLKAGAHALILAAIYEFQRRAPPRWQYSAPVALTLVIAAVLVDDIRGRFIWVGIVYGLQIVLIARALLSDPETRAGRAWRLLFGGAAMIVLVLGLRAFVAISGQSELAQPQNAIAPNWVQIVSFVAVMATTLLGSMGFMLMVKERTDRAILHLAMTDSLTQIPNRRALMDYAERVLAQRSGGPIAMLMIDVDNFKQINDAHGHLAGDEVLRSVAGRLVRRLRGHDLLGRYGGEEFCVVAPDTNAAGALTLAESLRECIASMPLEIEGGKIPVSISIGVSFSPSSASRKLKELLAEADTALYAAKQAGRNRVAGFGVQPA
jgi:diguanylate cyclase (GGDEF)-like protein